MGAGLVRLDFGDGRYLVEDVTGYSERVWREDIITMKDDLGKRHVIALHPDHEFRYKRAFFYFVVYYSRLFLSFS